ncbi:MAG: hypothetical protein AB7E81_16560 [Hyphomicrobiaceae bacterium]
MAADYLSGYFISGQFKELSRREFHNAETGRTDLTRRYVVYVHHSNGLVKDVNVKIRDEDQERALTKDAFYLFEVETPRPSRDGKAIYYTLAVGSEPIPSPRIAE